MIPPTFAPPVNVCNSICLGITSGGAFDLANRIVQSAAATAIILALAQLGKTAYQYIDVTLSNAGTVAGTVTVALSDRATIALAGTLFTYSGTLPLRGKKLVARLPYIDFIQSLTINASASMIVVVEKIEFVPAPESFAFNQEAFGALASGVGISTAITGAGVTNVGFSSADVHSWTLTTANTGGITYTFAPALVAGAASALGGLGNAYSPPVVAAPNPPGTFEEFEVAPTFPSVVPTYYVVQLFAPQACSVSYGGLTHSFLGVIQLFLSLADFSSLILALSCVNASGATQTFTLAAFAANFNYAANVWAAEVDTGA